MFLQFIAPDTIYDYVKVWLSDPYNSYTSRSPLSGTNLLWIWNGATTEYEFRRYFVKELGDVDYACSKHVSPDEAITNCIEDHLRTKFGCRMSWMEEEEDIKVCDINQAVLYAAEAARIRSMGESEIQMETGCKRICDRCWRNFYKIKNLANLKSMNFT